MQVEGRQAEKFDGARSPQFVGQLEGQATIRVDDKTCPDFWLAVTLSPEEVAELAVRAGFTTREQATAVIQRRARLEDQETLPMPMPKELQEFLQRHQRPVPGGLTKRGT